MTKKIEVFQTIIVLDNIAYVSRIKTKAKFSPGFSDNDIDIDEGSECFYVCIFFVGMDDPLVFVHPKKSVLEQVKEEIFNNL